MIGIWQKVVPAEAVVPARVLILMLEMVGRMEITDMAPAHRHIHKV